MELRWNAYLLQADLGSVLGGRLDTRRRLAVSLAQYHQVRNELNLTGDHV